MASQRREVAPDPAWREMSSALDAARAEVEHLATHDTLTGCLTRVGIAKALTVAQGGGGLVVALFVDCDDFDRVNDMFGHTMGDVVLRELAARIRDGLREGDTLARLGGDRFLALLPASDAVEARAIAERIRLAVATQPFAWDPGPLQLTVSIGMARLPPSATSLEEVLSLARIALQKSKIRGKNRVSSPDDASTATAWLAPALRAFMAAVQDGEGLHMFAQGIYALPSEGVVGWELLVRGSPGPLASPADLFRMATEHHLSTTVDMFCLRLAVPAATRARLQGSVHLNILPATLLEVATEQIVALLATPPPGVRWCLELSERQFLGDPEELVNAVGLLRRAGICVAVDDVGSCRGTLDSVVVLEPEIAKLDIRLVRGIAQDPGHRRLVERLMKMAGALDVDVVAEGIENREDLAVLLDLGVRMGQGFLWGRPTLLGTG
ncbi:MAG: EAL domain-containing protein [Pseudomonadota bacterium]|nr:EAL domain-containing protein [Pseudomonadota bacterium]